MPMPAGQSRMSTHTDNSEYTKGTHIMHIITRIMVAVVAATIITASGVAHADENHEQPPPEQEHNVPPCVEQPPPEQPEQPPVTEQPEAPPVVEQPPAPETPPVVTPPAPPVTQPPVPFSPPPAPVTPPVTRTPRLPETGAGTTITLVSIALALIMGGYMLMTVSKPRITYRRAI